MSENFYDKVAKKFGGYAYGSKKERYQTVYTDGVPEDDFKDQLLGLSSKNKTALDVGCGDCKFAFENSGYFKKILGIDNSENLLNVARKMQKKTGIGNVFLVCCDAAKTDFKNESFDLAFSRRGPTPYKETYRILKPGGYFVIIGIGEKDTMDLKKVFGRGQNYGGWNDSTLKEIQNVSQDAGFKILFSKEYIYDEYYKTYEDLDSFLQRVPIFTDFDPLKDKPLLEKYTAKFTLKKGIRLPRHRVVATLLKP